MSKKIIVICKRSTYQRYLGYKKEFCCTNSKSYADYLKKLKQIDSIQSENQKKIKIILDNFKKKKLISYKIIKVRSLISKKEINSADLIISFGGDGTFLYSAHQITSTVPLLGVNSNPDSSVGNYCNYNIKNVASALSKFLNSKLIPTETNRLVFEIDSRKLKISALNDCLIAHENPAGTTKYSLFINKSSRTLSGSGLLISTKTGSTGWMHQVNGLVHKNKSFIQVNPLGIKIEKPFFIKDLSVKMFSVNTNIFIDGFNNKVKLLTGSELKISLGNNIFLF